MKTLITILKLVAAAGVATVLVQIGYYVGRADGWHMAINDYQTYLAYQKAYDLAGPRRRQEDISRAWTAACAAGQKRAGEWFSGNFLTRIERNRNIHPTEIWKLPVFPAELLSNPERGVDLFPGR